MKGSTLIMFLSTDVNMYAPIHHITSRVNRFTSFLCGQECKGIPLLCIKLVVDKVPFN